VDYARRLTRLRGCATSTLSPHTSYSCENLHESPRSHSPFWKA